MCVTWSPTDHSYAIMLALKDLGHFTHCQLGDQGFSLFWFKAVFLNQGFQAKHMYKIQLSLWFTPASSYYFEVEPLEDFFSKKKYSGISTTQFCFHSFWNRQNFGGFVVTIRIIQVLCCELDKTEFIWEIRFLFDSLINSFWTMKIVFVTM